MAFEITILWQENVGFVKISDGIFSDNTIFTLIF